MVNLAWNAVGVEPEMRVAGVNSKYTHFGDFKAERVAFFDNSIVNTDAPSYASQSWSATSRHHALA